MLVIDLNCVFLAHPFARLIATAARASECITSAWCRNTIANSSASFTASTGSLTKGKHCTACDNPPSAAPPALSPNSLWIYTMNRCTLALRGRALLCLDFITSVNAEEAA